MKKRKITQHKFVRIHLFSNKPRTWDMPIVESLKITENLK